MGDLPDRKDRPNRAVLIDRDGVLINDIDLLRRPQQVELIEGSAKAVKKLRRAGFRVLVVTNQTIIARGLASESDVDSVHERIQRMLEQQEGTCVDGFYVCPHHPNADLPRYRTQCHCRKPRPGLLEQAAREHDLDLRNAYMIGDRVTDILAGRNAGARTILVRSGRHQAPPIETPERIPEDCQPDHLCGNLAEAADTILKEAS